MGRLTASACYLAGPMTECNDLGASWRHDLEQLLRPMGVVVLNPVDKPIEIGKEDEAARHGLKEAQERGDLPAVRRFMKVIRRVDLRCCDLASFIIVRHDGTDTFGTHEEVSTGVLEQKPVLLLLEGELTAKNVNPWVFAQFPLDHIFESREALMAYLRGIHEASYHPSDRRWMLFDFARLYREALAQCE